MSKLDLKLALMNCYEDINLHSIELKEILSNLIAYKSITPNDADCQQYMLGILEQLGFRCETFNKHPVSNFYAEFGSGNKLLMFAGHTDVVPTGDEKLWKYNPFVLTEENNKFFGRGVADMKGSLACMLVACHKFVQNYSKKSG